MEHLVHTSEGNLELVNNPYHYRVGVAVRRRYPGSEKVPEGATGVTVPPRLGTNMHRTRVNWGIYGELNTRSYLVEEI